MLFHQLLRGHFFLRAKVAGEVFFVLCFLAFTTHDVRSEGLVISGVSEGVQIVLPSGLSTTNLAISVTCTGLCGNPNTVLWLEWQGSIVRSVTSAPPFSITFSNLVVGKYFLGANIHSTPHFSSDVSFDIVTQTLQPLNDHWSNAVPITLPVSSDNTFATRELNEPIHSGNAGGRSLWWYYQATSNGVITASTTTSGIDTVLAVYTGTNLATLNQIAFNDDMGVITNTFSQVSFMASAGTRYYFAVDGVVNASGVVSSGFLSLRLFTFAPPLITLISPSNGLTMLVASPATSTNVNVSATITHPSGINQVQYWFNGDNAITDSGILFPPYQLPLTNLTVGNYWLTLRAFSSQGIISAEHFGFEVIAESAQILLVDYPLLSTQGFRFSVTGMKGLDYDVQCSTNLVAWNSLSLRTNFPGATKVTDTNAIPTGNRFYRAVSQ
jgi:hypothetical protein